MPSLGDLFVTVGAKLEGFEQAMGSVSERLAAVSKDAASAGQGFERMGAQMMRIGGTLTAALTVPLAGFAAAASKAAIDYDEALDTIRAGTGATGDSLKALGSSFSTVFSSVPASAQQVAAAIADLNTRLGVTGPNLESLATQMLNLARITGAEVGPLIAAGTRLFGDWSVATEKQSETLDYLFRVSQTTGIGVESLMQLVVQFGAPLRALGYDIESAAALMGKWEQEGVNLETVLSGLRFALGNFAKANREPKEALQATIAAIQNAKSESEATAIAFDIFGKRAAIDMSRAILEGRFNIESLVTTLKNSKETINTAAQDTLSFGERLALLKNRAQEALVPLGQSLISALESLLSAAQPVIAGIKSLGDAFAALPPGAQTVIVALGAFLAAIGPLVAAIGGLVSTVGSIVTVFSGASGAIAVLSPALTAIAAIVATVAAAFAAWKLIEWAYDNIEPFRKIVSALWDVLSAVADLVGTVVVAAFRGLVAIVSQVASFVADSIREWVRLVNQNEIVRAVVDALSGALEKVAGWLRAITGWLKSFGDATQQAAEPAKELQKAVTNQTTAFTSATKASSVLAGSIDDLRKKHKDSKAEVADHSKELERWEKAQQKARSEALKADTTWATLSQSVRDLTNRQNALRDSIVRLRLDQERQGPIVESIARSADALSASTARLTKEHIALTATFPPILSGMESIGEDVRALDQAYRTLGLTSTTQLRATTEEFKRAAEAINKDPNASQFVKDQAMLKYFEAMAAEMRAAGQQIPAEMERMMDKLKASTGKLDDVKGSFKTFGTEVSTIVTNFAQDLAKTLFDGDMSWAERFKAMWGSIRDALVASFIEPAAAALKHFASTVLRDILTGDFSLSGIIDVLKGIGGVIKDLVTGDFSFDRLVDKLKGLGSIIGMVGSGGSIATPTIPSVPTTPSGGGGVGGAGGAVGTAIGSAAQLAMGVVAPWITAGASVANAVFSFLSYRQMEKDMDVLIKHTLALVMIQGAWFDWGLKFLEAIFGQLQEHTAQFWSMILGIEAIPMAFSALTSSLSEIREELISLKYIANDLKNESLPLLKAIADGAASDLFAPLYAPQDEDGAPAADTGATNVLLAALVRISTAANTLLDALIARVASLADSLPASLTPFFQAARSTITDLSSRSAEQLMALLRLEVMQSQTIFAIHENTAVLRELGLAGGGHYTINISGAGDPQEVADRVIAYLQEIGIRP